MALYQRLIGGFVMAAAIWGTVSCSSSSDSSSMSSTSASGGYAVTNLVSNRPAAATAQTTDPNLVNPWGIAFGPFEVWVANNGTQTSAQYNGDGTPFASLPLVTLPAGTDPTGIVYNSTSIDFGGAMFIFDGEGGTLVSWSSSSGATVAKDNSASGAVYKGLAIANNGGANFLYATDFHNDRVQVFNSSFNDVTVSGGFTFVDPSLPSGYGPFGIQAIGTKIYVTYAQHTAGSGDETDGPGLGVVDAFNTDGSFVKRFVSNGSGSVLNAPWGVAMAPANFGTFSNDLLIGNFGDGTINAFDPATGALVGTFKDQSNNAIVLSGLWGIAFGNGADNQPTNTLFFAAGLNDEADGLYGRIDYSAPTTGSGSGGSGPVYP
jgi:uncharacterized protein (TIGR03118 family)